MNPQDREILTSQLGDAIAALQDDTGDPFEVAVLAGLLLRRRAASGGAAATVAEEDSPLGQARRLLSTGALAESLPPADLLTQLVERLCALSEEDADEERADILLDLDEHCAGSWFLGQPERCQDACEEAAAVIRSFPALYRPLAGWASRILADAPPHATDPANHFWRALEASQFAAPMDYVPTCDAARRRLALPLVISRASAVAQPAAPLMFAASEFPKTPQLVPLSRGQHFEIGLGHTADGQPALLMTSTEALQLSHNGRDVALERLAPHLLRAPAAVGHYHLRAGDEALDFEVSE